jgi:hypothetical protein
MRSSATPPVASVTPNLLLLEIRRAFAAYSLPSRSPSSLGRRALLGSRISDVQIPEHGTTTVHYADGAAIMIYESEAHHESYQIDIGKRLIFV